MILSHGNRLELGEWPPKAGVTSGGRRVPTLEELEREHISSVLELSLGLACEELEYVDTSLRVILSVHMGLNSLTLLS